MKKRTISTVHTVNIVFQSIFTLAMYIGLGLLIGWLASTYWGAERWIYVPCILGGVAIGFVSMVRFVLLASRNLEWLEKQHKRDERARRSTDGAPEASNDTKEMNNE
ncbi:MAG: AtpZ/AtpI family protein [Clostridia bacterium]|nr:AtpZ/AtpI family protein [Clostridia bacterium]